MSAFDDLSYPFEEFAGRVRLFPLPNLVLFPHVMQPLHVSSGGIASCWKTPWPAIS